MDKDAIQGKLKKAAADHAAVQLREINHDTSQ